MNRENLKDRKERAANSGWISAVAGYAPLPDFSSFEVLVVFAVQKQITTCVVMYGLILEWSGIRRIMSPMIGNSDCSLIFGNI